jgi:hypothetical protein
LPEVIEYDQISAYENKKAPSSWIGKKKNEEVRILAVAVVLVLSSFTMPGQNLLLLQKLKETI